MSDQFLHHKHPSYLIRRRFFRNKPALCGFYVIIFAQFVALLGYLIMPDNTPNAAEGGSIFMKKMDFFSSDIILLKEKKNETVEKVNFWTRMWYGQASEFQTIYPVTDYTLRGDSIYFYLWRKDARPHMRQSSKQKFGKEDTLKADLKGKFENRSMFEKKSKEDEQKKFLLDFVKPLYASVGEESMVHIFKENLKKSPYFKGDTLLYAEIQDKAQSYHHYKRADTLFYRSINDKYYFRTDTIVYIDIEKNIQFTTINNLQNEFKAKHVEERTFYLGTDQAGRDVLSRIILGTRISLSIGFVSVLISLFVGVTLGAVAGYYQGVVDNIVSWLMTVIWSIPSIMLVIAISLVLGSKGLWVVFVAIGLTIWVDIARIVRGEVMSIKQKLYVESAKAFGLSNFTIIYKHILPNLLGSMVVILFANFASAILMEAGLSFLGIGVQIPIPSWGNMLKDGWNEPNSAYLVMMPSLCIIVLVLAFNLLGNGLRDALDPKNVSN